MTTGKVKSIEKTPKVPESSSPSRAFARQPSVGVSQSAFDNTLVPQMAGNLAVQQLFRSGAIQAKLEISQPGDPDEEEADRVADHVMWMVEPAPIGSAPSSIQRKCAACAAGGTTCPKCEEEEKVRRKEMPGHVPQAGPAVHSQIAGLRGGGQPLPPSVRAFFEPQFGRDFSQVRVHADRQAAETARAIQARAFTLGSDVVFGAGACAPQRWDGRRLLAHELTHVVQQGKAGAPSGLIQRDTSTPAPAVPPAAPLAASGGSGDAELAEREQKAFDAAKARAGQQAVMVYFDTIGKDPRETEIFTIEKVVERQAATPKRLGFDAEGPAKAYASMIAQGQGAVAIEQAQEGQTFFFAARLNKGSKELRSRDADSTEVPTWRIVISLGGAWVGAKIGQAIKRSYVYKVEPIAGSVKGMASQDGSLFPLNAELETDPSRMAMQGGKFIPIKPGSDMGQGGPPQMATPVDAHSLRAIAGIASEGSDKDHSPKMADEVEMTPAQQDSFIQSYLRVRGLETLTANESLVESLAKTFEPTMGSTPGQPAHGVSDAAKKLIDSGRVLGIQYREILEKETQLAIDIDYMQQMVKAHSELQTTESRTWGKIPGKKISAGEQRKTADEWIADMQSKKGGIKNKKDELMALSPVLAQLAPKEAAGIRNLNYGKGASPEPQRDRPTENPYDQSLLAQRPSAQSDEQICAEFARKLDAVRQAIRHARAEMVGADINFLLKLSGLRRRVEADFLRATGKNAGLKDRFDQLKKQATDDEMKKDFLGISISVALLFVPGGQLLSAALGFGLAAEKMNEHLREWDASKAAVDPASALADQQDVERKLASATLDLAINALFLDSEVNAALKAMEEGGSAAATAGRLVVKPGLEPGVLAQAVTEDGHMIKVTEFGIVMCSPPPCALLSARYADVLAKDTGGVFAKRISAIEGMAPDKADDAAKAMASLQKELARVARQGRTAEIVEAIQKDAQLASLLNLQGVGGDLSKLTGQQLIQRLGMNEIASSEVVAQLKQAMGMLQHEAGDLSGRVLQVEGIEEFFKGALTSSNPHTVDFELVAMVEQLRLHPDARFRYQMPLGTRAGPDLVRYGDRTATVLQFKSFRGTSDLIKDTQEQVYSDLDRLQQQNFMLPGPGGQGRVPVDQTMIYEIDFTRLKADRPETSLHTLENELQERLNDYLARIAAQDSAFSIRGQPYRIQVRVR